MPQVCRVCTNTNRSDIDRLVAEGLPKRAIARQFGLHRGSLDRHSRSHLTQEVARAAEQSRLANAVTCQQTIRGILCRALEGVEEARGTADLAKMIHAGTKAVGLLGQLTGEIRSNSLAALFRRLGVHDEAELRRIVEAHRQPSASTVEDCEADGVQLLRWVMDQKPDRRPAILDALRIEQTESETRRPAWELHRAPGA